MENPSGIKLDGLEFVPFVSEAEIQCAVDRVSQQIMADHEEEIPVFIGVLNGAYMFVSDLMKRYEGPCEVEFIKVKSYDGLASTGKINELIGLEFPKDRALIIVEDIVDTGNTIEKIIQGLGTKGISNFKIASLFLKPDIYKKSYKIDYVGMEIPHKFIVGHGLDYNGLGRNLTAVYQLKE